MTPIIKLSKNFGYIASVQSTYGWTHSADTTLSKNTTNYYEIGAAINIEKSGSTLTYADAKKQIILTDMSGKSIKVHLFLASLATQSLLTSIGIEIILEDSLGAQIHKTFPSSLLSVGRFVQIQETIESFDVLSGVIDETKIKHITIRLHTTSALSTWAAGEIIVGKVGMSYTAQILDAYQIRFSRDLDTIEAGFFTLDRNSPNIDIVNELDKVEICGVLESSEITLFTGLIMPIRISPNEFVYECADEKKYLERKITTSTRDWTSMTLANVLKVLTEEVELRSKEPIAYYTNTPDTVISGLEHEAGTSLMQILDDIAQLLNYEWRVEKGVIYVDSQVGEDKSAELTLRWNVDNPAENNIDNFELVYSGDQIFTYVQGKNNGGSTQKQNNTEVFGWIEKFVSLSDGDLDTLTQNYVNQSGEQQLQISIAVSSDVDFSNVNVGDTIGLVINGGNTRQNITTTIKVRKKEAVMANNTIIWSVVLKNENIAVRTISGMLRSLNDRVKIIEINS